MKLSTAGANLIANFEGFRSRPYRDAVGVWTIGYGSTGGVGPNSRPVTRAQALARLKREVDANYGAAVNRLRVPLNQNQYDALCSFTYNLGPGAIGVGTGIGQALRARQYGRAANELLKWDKAGGRRLLGLTRRRQAERALFLRKPKKVEVLNKDEASWLHSYHHPKNAAQKARAYARLAFRARRIRTLARAEREGWGKYDRSERYTKIAKNLGWKV